MCGGRDFGKQPGERGLLSSTLNDLHTRKTITLLINGGARGADQLAALWGMNKPVPVLTLCADWEKYGKAAGHIRNSGLLKYEPDLIVAFRGGRGTSNMVSQARDKGITVWSIL